MKTNKPRQNAKPTARRGIGSLIVNGHELVKALEDDEHGAAVRDALPSTFQLNFADALTLLVRITEDLTRLCTLLGGAVKDRASAIGDILLLAQTAREAAKVVLAGQPDVLRDKFKVGGYGFGHLDQVQENATRLLAACREYADRLAPHGWGAKQTAALEAALERFSDAGKTIRTTCGARRELRSAQAVAAKQLLTQCRSLQDVVDELYPLSLVGADPSVADARVRFGLRL